MNCNSFQYSILFRLHLPIVDIIDIPLAQCRLLAFQADDELKRLSTKLESEKVLEKDNHVCGLS